MVTRFLSSTRLLWCLSSIALIGQLNAQVPANPTGQESPETAEVSDADAMKALGQYIGQQIRLQIGFTDEELENLFAGMRAAARDEPLPENFPILAQRGQDIAMGHMQEYQRKMTEKAAEAAAENKAKGADFLAKLDSNPAIKKTASGLRYEILTEGTGAQATSGDTVKVNYRGTLVDGTEFDAGEGASFPVAGVVPGFGEGLQLLKVGSKARLYIPSELAYGDGPQRPGSLIAPGSTLVFDVEVLEVVPAARPTPPANFRPAQSQPGRPAGAPPSTPPNMTPPPPPSSVPPPPPQTK